MISYKIFGYVNKLNVNGKQLIVNRELSLNLRYLQQVVQESSSLKEESRTDDEWMQAKEYDALPGPSRTGLLLDFLPGGKLHNANLIEMNRIWRERYGDIFRTKGIFGRPDIVFTYNPKDFEMTYRNEGIWPHRGGLETNAYYRNVKRPDIFNGIGGLVSEQGKSWANIRYKVNPILLKLQNVRQNLPQINDITNEFIARLELLRDPTTNMLSNSFHEELKMWSFEAIAFIALNMRMGLMTDKPDPNARKLADNMQAFFQYSYDYDIAPAFWKYYETSGFKRLINNYDSITEITIDYIERSMKKFESEGNKQAKSVLEKLCRIDKQVALVMVMDMLMAGIDTTSSAFITTLYAIAKNPQKQELLRKEVNSIMPSKATPLTEENTKNMPYLRACIKEALRITPITPGNYRDTDKDLVLSGYRVPKGTGILMNVMATSNTDEFFPRSKEFLPERWLKSGPSACPQAKSKNPFVYLPFGFGPRTCIGKRIAEMEIETLLTKLIRNYRVSWCGEKDLSYISNIILIPHGKMDFKFEPIKN